MTNEFSYFCCKAAQLNVASCISNKQMIWLCLSWCSSNWPVVACVQITSSHKTYRTLIILIQCSYKYFLYFQDSGCLADFSSFSFFLLCQASLLLAWRLSQGSVMFQREQGKENTRAPVKSSDAIEVTYSVREYHNTLLFSPGFIL